MAKINREFKKHYPSSLTEQQKDYIRKHYLTKNADELSAGCLAPIHKVYHLKKIEGLFKGLNYRKKLPPSDIFNVDDPENWIM